VTSERRFRLGVNYWPAATALRWWESSDVGAVAADLERIATAGFDSVRFFLTWEAFQPSPQDVRTEMLDRLVATADAAATAGLALMPTLFTGHMSGVNFIPPWALNEQSGEQRFRVIAGGTVDEHLPRNWYGDEVVTAAQVRLAGACATALNGHPALWAWDLGNENSNCTIPPNKELARAWLGRVSDAIRAADADVAVTTGLHMEDLESDRHLGPVDAAAVCDFLTMHGYPIYAPWAMGPTDEHLLGFLTKVTRWLGGEVDVLFSEFGLPTVPVGDAADPPGASTMLVDEDVAAQYTDRALQNLRAAGATGAMLWCANDYAPEVWRVPPLDEAIHERHFGLWRSDGAAKPAVAVVAAHRDLQIVAPADDVAWIDIERDAFFTPTGSHLARLYACYREQHG
jgi:endo-1,4-beta-mannosidase